MECSTLCIRMMCGHCVLRKRAIVVFRGGEKQRSDSFRQHKHARSARRHFSNMMMTTDTVSSVILGWQQPSEKTSVTLVAAVTETPVGNGKFCHVVLEMLEVAK